MSLLGDSRPGRTAGDVPGSGRMDGEVDRDGVRNQDGGDQRVEVGSQSYCGSQGVLVHGMSKEKSKC